MPKAFVHGNPETSAVWSVLFDELEAKWIDDLVALSPPGFGASLPEGFEATQTGYRNWLIQQLEQLGGNVDLVGHDWGAGHVYGVLAERPDLAGICRKAFRRWRGVRGCNVALDTTTRANPGE